MTDIHDKLINQFDDEITKDSGEYIVSEIARKIIENELKYKYVPLAELLGREKSGNPGFDFHTENHNEVLIFGEAKYSSSINSYGVGLKQVVRFIEEKKDLKDLLELRDFIDPKVLNNASTGIKGFAIGFSSKDTSSSLLIKNIIKNTDYQKLRSYDEVLLVAVNI